MHARSRAIVLMNGTLAVLALTTVPAHAVGCLSGAAGGALAGHVAGGHAVLGAAGGCIVGHELAVRKDRENEANHLIADYETHAEGSPARAKDLAGISRLARKDVPIAVKWLQTHNVSAK